MSTTTTHPVQEGQRYRRMLLGLYAVAVVGFGAGVLLDQFLAGLVVYSLGALGGVVATLYLEFWSPVQLLDERDRRVHERASHAVVNLFAYVGLPTFVGLFLLDATGTYAFGPTASGVLYAFSGFYLVWGAAYVVLRRRT